MKKIWKFHISRRVNLAVLIALIMIILILLPDLAQAEPGIFFVSTTGSSSNCTQAAPCQLTTALQKAVDTEIIYLAAGTYHAAGDAVVSITRDITLYGGWDGSATGPIYRDPHLYPSILDGQDVRRVVVISNGSAPVLDGLVITNGYGDFSGAGVRSNVSHPTIKGCTIQDNDADGDGGGIFINGGSAQIIDNRIVNNSANWAGGLRIINNPQVTIKGNLVLGNEAINSGGGIEIECCGGSVVHVEGNTITSNSAGAAGGGVNVVSTNAMLVNNIIAENTATEGAGVYLEGTETYTVDVDLINNTLRGLSSNDHAIWLEGYSEASFTNNILSNFAIGIQDNDSASTVINADYNLFFNTSDPILGTNVIQLDPLLDIVYHLTGDSPAINAGLVVQNPDDIDGDPRPNGSFDLGADEYYPRLNFPFLVRLNSDF